MLVNSIFSISHNVFYQSEKEFLVLNSIYFVVFKCFQFGPASKRLVKPTFRENCNQDKLEIFIDINLPHEPWLCTVKKFGRKTVLNAFLKAVQKHFFSLYNISKGFRVQ